jgi:hypothetical protein
LTVFGREYGDERHEPPRLDGFNLPEQRLPQLARLQNFTESPRVLNPDKTRLSVHDAALLSTVDPVLMMI